MGNNHSPLTISREGMWDELGWSEARKSRERNLCTNDAAWLADTFARNRREFSGYRMEDDPKPEQKPDPNADVLETKPPKDDDLGDAGKRAIQAERDARKLVEAELATIKKSLTEAFGVKPDPKDPNADVLETVQQQVADMRHESAVLRAANQHNITDEDDLALLESTKDPEAMGKLAVRLAAKTGEDGKPPTPKPDLTQGGRGDPAKPESLPGVPRMAQAFEDELATK